MAATKFFWKTRIFFDFGQSFNFGSEYFTGWLAPRSVNGLGDYFAFDLLPRINGLYSKEMLASTDLPYAEPQVDAVFLSHAHFDHVTHIQFLDPEIPIYLGVGTKLFMESMEETSSFCDFSEPNQQFFCWKCKCLMCRGSRFESSQPASNRKRK